MASIVHPKSIHGIHSSSKIHPRTIQDSSKVHPRTIHGIHNLSRVPPQPSTLLHSLYNQLYMGSLYYRLEYKLMLTRIHMPGILESQTDQKASMDAFLDCKKSLKSLKYYWRCRIDVECPGYQE